MERFSMKQVLHNKFGEVEKSTKKSQNTSRANKKVKNEGKYITKIVDGVKYMVLK